jgi:hemoglobin
MTTTTSGGKTTIYDAIGGADAVSAAVGLLYQRLIADAALASYFEGIDMRRLNQHMRAFIAVALGGPGIYAGRDLGAAHSRLRITNEHFDAVAGHLAAVLAELGVPDELNRAIIARVGSLRPVIVAAPLVAVS